MPPSRKPSLSPVLPKRFTLFITVTLFERYNHCRSRYLPVSYTHLDVYKRQVQELADYTGDSLELSRIAAAVEAEVIVLCGVHFMAESAAVLAPEKVVLLPEKDAGCPLADTVTPEGLRLYKEKYPDAAVVTYINSSAAVKAESDICVTSANAALVVDSLEAERIIFVPDCNLAHFVSRQTKKEIIPWPGYCITHHRISCLLYTSRCV